MTLERSRRGMALMAAICAVAFAGTCLLSSAAAVQRSAGVVRSARTAHQADLAALSLSMTGQEQLTLADGRTAVRSEGGTQVLLRSAEGKTLATVAAAISEAATDSTPPAEVDNFPDELQEQSDG